MRIFEEIRNIRRHGIRGIMWDEGNLTLHTGVNGEGLWRLEGNDDVQVQGYCQFSLPADLDEAKRKLESGYAGTWAERMGR